LSDEENLAQEDEPWHSLGQRSLPTMGVRPQGRGGRSRQHTRVRERKLDMSQEVCSGTNCDGYRGMQTKTESGKTCQDWSKQSPQAHEYTPQEYPDFGLDSNYCRNPGTSADRLWCYTTDPSERWNYCSPIKEAEGFGEEKCSGKNCDGYRGRQNKTVKGAVC